MTTIGHESIACAACGETSQHAYLTSTNSFGPPDLDLRPPPMRRSTISLWVQQCPSCGFVSGRIDAAEDDEIALWRTAALQRDLANITESGLIGQFRARALIEERLGRFDAAARHALCAAWIADDQDDPSSPGLRSRAADLLMDALPGAAADEQTPMRAQLIDILRRAHRWTEAITVANDVLAAEEANETIRQVALFGRARAEARDDAGYTIADATPNASR